MSEVDGLIVVLGSSGFIGSNLVRYLKNEGHDVVGSTAQTIWEDLKKNPKIVFNCIAYGAKKNQTAPSLMYETNFILTYRILSLLSEDCIYIHAGSCSEYGGAVSLAKEDMPLRPITPYGVSKAAASNLIWYYGKILKRRVANLRLYCVYGPGDHQHSLISTVIDHGKRGLLPAFKNPLTHRDFVYIDDACHAFLLAAMNLHPLDYGESFNVGGSLRDLRHVAEHSKKVFNLDVEPVFDLNSPVEMWSSSCVKSQVGIGYVSQISFEGGFDMTVRASGSY